MKRFLRNIIASVLSVSVVAFFPLQAQAYQPQSIVVLGDSISSGYGLTGYPSSTVDNYGNLFAAQYEAKVENLAVDGSTSAYWISAAEAAADTIADADTILMSVGGNDVLGLLLDDLQAFAWNSISTNISAITSEQLQDIFSTDIVGQFTEQLQQPDVMARYTEAGEGYADNLLAIVSAIKQANPTAPLFIQTIYNPFDGATGFEALSDIAQEILAPINEAILINADQAGYLAVDVHTAFVGQGMALTNIGRLDIHPNAAGHAKIAQEIAAVATIPAQAQVADDEVQEDNPNTSATVISIAVVAGAMALAILLRKSRKA